MALSDEEVLARFVLRARRIESHSLVQAREEFMQRLESRTTLRFAPGGAVTFIRPLPADEEVFESLAARVRPLTMDREPIYYKKVLKAIESVLGSCAAASEQERDHLARLAQGWQQSAAGQQVQAYALMGANADGTDPTGPVTDTELAFGWMYADLAHADPIGWKQKALSFKLDERYAAAVDVFSRLAAATVATLRFVEHLRDHGMVHVEESVWTEDVVVGKTEIRYQGTAYVAQVETEMPALSDPMEQVGGPWSRLTLTDHLRRDPRDEVTLELRGSDGSLVRSYEAAVVHRSQDEDLLHWHVLVADSLIFRVQVGVHGEQSSTVSLDVVFAGNSRRATRDANQVLLGLQDADQMTFLVQGQAVFTWAPDRMEHDAVLALRASTELLDDLVVLEDLTGRAIDDFTQEITLFERVRLRQARLLWEGHAVQWDRALPPAVSPTGVVPQAVAISSGAIKLGGVDVARPEVLLGHPEAIWNEQGHGHEIGVDARSFTATLPQGMRFLAWSPPARQDDQDTMPLVGTPWALTGIDQDQAPF